MKIIIEQVAVANNAKNELTVTVGVFDDTHVIGERSFNLSLAGILVTADIHTAIETAILNFATSKNWTIAANDILWP